MITKDGGSAFPAPSAAISNLHGDADWRIETNGGMTLRDYFVAKAMQGSLAGTPGGHLIPDNLAPECYRYADAMLKAREVKP